MKSIILFVILQIVFSAPNCSPGKNLCTMCSSNNLCIKCKIDALIPDKNGGCLTEKCSEGGNYCEQCNEKGTLCEECNSGYYPDGIGGCSYTDNCKVSYRGECLLCEDNYVLIGQETGLKICKSKRAEDFLNCKEIDYSTGYCNICEDGYFLNDGDLKCIETKNCFESAFGQCISCDKGYYLDKNDGKTCKSVKENKSFLYCRETEDGENCSKCDKEYYFDEDGKCVNTNFCKTSSNFFCEECLPGYYLIDMYFTCATTKNCKTSDRNTGLCISCSYGYYFDESDGKCKSNQEDDDLKYCKYFRDKCISCEETYKMGEDDKCTNTPNCAESEFGICKKCSNKYYLDKNHKCSRFANCKYSEFSTCKECKDNYYYNKNIGECQKVKEGFEDCKISDIYALKCAECKDDYYLLPKDKLCYSNEEEGPLFKCSIANNDGTECTKCISNYYLGSKDKKCSKYKNCAVSEDDKCIECNKNFHLDDETEICVENK